MQGFPHGQHERRRAAAASWQVSAKEATQTGEDSLSAKRTSRSVGKLRRQRFSLPVVDVDANVEDIERDVWPQLGFREFDKVDVDVVDAAIVCNRPESDEATLIILQLPIAGRADCRESVDDVDGSAHAFEPPGPPDPVPGARTTPPDSCDSCATVGNLLGVSSCAMPRFTRPELNFAKGKWELL